MGDKIMVTRSSMPPLEEYIEEIRSLWDTRWLTNSGPKHGELERKLCEYLGVSTVSLCTNGHLALECILEVFDLEGEVITTPFTFVSTTNAIVRCGLTPVFCDINPDDFTIDVNKIESLINEKTCAIMPVHVYGNICDNEAIEKLAEKYNLKVIYDAAHAFGVRKNGVGIGNFGDASMFSFHATKVFHSIEGGAAVFKDGSNYQKAIYRKNFGLTAPETLTYHGGNSKMNEFCAAMGLCNLRHIDEAIASRRGVYERYSSRLEGVKGLQLNSVQEGVQRNYAYFPLVVHPEEFGCDREAVMSALAENDVIARRYFYPLTSTVESFGGAYSLSDTPVAAKISERVLCLPIYENMELETVDRICNIILSIER